MQTIIKNSAAHFVSNNIDNNATVLKEIQVELSKCDSFSMSVAFITKQGLQLLKHELRSLADNGINGRILTSAYQYFNDPLVYSDLLEIGNVEVRIYDNSKIKDHHTKGPHHTKGYIFEKDNNKTIIIGSSNLTSGALKTNREWNLKLEGVEDSQMIDKIYGEFEEMWEISSPLSHDWISSYEIEYKSNIREMNPYKVEETKVFPNTMQQEALRNLEALRDDGADKALLISATGTGKTYLSAFDVKNFGAKKALFIIHREQIAKDAKETFKKVMPHLNVGMLTGNRKDYDADIIFSTIQTLSKEYAYSNFERDHFDYIIFDEVHRAGAATYTKVMDYFKPGFMLGMSATPERNDEVNIFKMFDYNIAYEIRLQGALEQEMISPFHYYGLTDIEIEGDVIDEKTDHMALVSEDRVAHIIDKMKYYGHDGDRVKGLIFCGKNNKSRNRVAESLSKEMNRQGLRTVALMGTSTQMEREDAIERLVNRGELDYIITVDIFNEGIDIPEINQIVMLRPTESAIIFVQQLGRGLRLHDSKDYVVVLDFIGNYKNNFLIPVALSGDRSYSRDTLNKYIYEGTSILPGVSSVEFDKIAKERIFKAINAPSFPGSAYFKEEYIKFKNSIGRTPTLMDFYNHDTLDPQSFLSKSNYRTFHNFKLLYDDEYSVELKDIEVAFLTLISYELNLSKRKVEVEILSALTEKHKISVNGFNEMFGMSNVRSAIRVLTRDFFSLSINKKYKDYTFVREEDGFLYLDESIVICLDNIYFYSEVKDLLEYYSVSNCDKYQNVDGLGFVVGEQYSRRDVSWILNTDTNLEGVFNGYMTLGKQRCTPVFVNYKKEEDIEDSINYHDHFVENGIFNWVSKSNRTLKSKDIRDLIDGYKNGYSVPLFVRKNTDYKEHYYLGEVDIVSFKETYMIVNKKNVPVVEFILKLRHSVKDDLYHYLTES